MHIDWLQIQNVRNLTNLRIQPSSKLNGIIGPNASGKTSILEAIYLLSRARSFRTSRTQEVIQHQKHSLMVTAGLRYANGARINTGIEKGGRKTVIHHNGANIKRISTQARNTPLVLLAPDYASLVTGTPKQRRSWLDWAMFHVEPGYLDDWRSYYKALRQRNRLLGQSPSIDEALSGWEHTMEQQAKKITVQRQEFLEKIQSNLTEITKERLIFPVETGLDKGWPEEATLLQHLQNCRETDRQQGYTKYGLQCADIYFRSHKKQLTAVCSRGQIKLFQIALSIAQARTIEQITGERPLYLVDDYQTELDHRSRSMVFELLKELDAQAFFTATEMDGTDTRCVDIKLFHVERGTVAKVVE